MKKQTISILGCGWYGLALAQELLYDGYIVKGSTTSLHKLTQLAEVGIKPYLINLDGNTDLFDPEFFTSDILIISIPPRSATYLNQIRRIVRLACSQVIFISSTGIYQDGNFVVNENTMPEPTSEAGKSLLAAESLLRENPRFTTTIIRFGGLIGPNRNLARHFAGKIGIANGLAPINLIHLDDCIGITKSILENKAFGVLYHAVSPNHPSRKDFYSQACLESGFEKPEFIDELGEWKQIETVMIPTVLNYKWKVLF